MYEQKCKPVNEKCLVLQTFQKEKNLNPKGLGDLSGFWS